MSPTLHIETAEGFSDWSECINPQCASPDELLEEYPKASPDEGYVRAHQDDKDAIERAWHSEWATIDKYYRIPSVNTTSPRDERGLDQALRKAHDLTKLADNWDDEGSPGYSPETWRRVKSFLLRQSSLATKVFRTDLPIPQINPADQGSIDVFWRLPKRQLLLNFPRETGSPITYHGRDETGRNTITGRTEENDARQDLVAWLIQTTI
jgi:hypothetical protein